MIRSIKSRLVPSLSLFPLAAALLVGCISQQHLTRGEAAYNAGNYPEAKDQLVAADEDKREYSGQQLAQLALYRGLTAQALGNKVDAGRWLAEAKIREAKDPGSLSADERNKMDLALQALLHDPPH